MCERCEEFERDDPETQAKKMEEYKLDAMDMLDKMRRPLNDEEKQEAGPWHEHSDIGEVTLSMSRHCASFVRHVLSVGLACVRRSQYDLKLLGGDVLVYERLLQGDRTALDEIPVLMATPEIQESVGSKGIDRHSLDLHDPDVQEMIRLSRNAYIAIQMVAFSEAGLLSERIKLELIRQEAEGAPYQTARLPHNLVSTAFKQFKRIWDRDTARHRDVYGPDWNGDWTVRDYAKWVMEKTDGMDEEELSRFDAMFADHFAIDGGEG